MQPGSPVMTMMMMTTVVNLLLRTRTLTPPAACWAPPSAGSSSCREAARPSCSATCCSSAASSSSSSTGSSSSGDRRAPGHATPPPRFHRPRWARPPRILKNTRLTHVTARKISFPLIIFLCFEAWKWAGTTGHRWCRTRQKRKTRFQSTLQLIDYTPITHNVKNKRSSISFF